MKMDDLECKRMQFLWSAGNVYANKMPQLSRHFVSRFVSFKKEHRRLEVEAIADDVTQEYCPHCHSILLPNNHAFKVIPKPRLNHRIRKLRRRAKEQGLLSNTERKMLRQWENATNKVSISCQVCNNRCRLPGGKRLHETPVNFDNSQILGSTSFTPGTFRSFSRTNTPNSSTQSSPYFSPGGLTTPSSGKMRTPSSGKMRTPSSGTPMTSSTGRKSKNFKRDKHQQLQRMLASAKKEKEESSKSPLSAFLKSL